MSLDDTLKSIRKEYGQSAIMRLTGDFHLNVPYTPSGIIQLDAILGVGGLPHGRIIEIYGPESSGKTTVCLKFIAAVQNSESKNKVAIVDTEHSLDPIWAEKNGVDVDELLISQPDTGEDALGITDQLVRDDDIGLVIVDSVAALVPRAELEGEMGDVHMGLQARLMSQAMRKLVGIVRKKGCILVFTNQIREKIGVTFGSPNTTPGGRALRFYASIRIEVRRTSWLKEAADKEPFGAQIMLKAVKNKVAPPFKQSDCGLLFETGFDEFYNLVEFAVAKKIIEKRGSWYSYDGEQLGQGKIKATDTVRFSEDIFEKLKRHVRSETIITEKENKEDDEKEFEKAAAKYNKYNKLLEDCTDEEKKKKYNKRMKSAEKILEQYEDWEQYI